MTAEQKRPAEMAANSEFKSVKYVSEAEDLISATGEVTVTIGDLQLTLDMRFPHERRYALGFQFGLRNPQADIDRQLFRAYVQAGDVVLDAGANVGVTAAEALACGAGHVICVEPERSLVRRLRALASVSSCRISVWDCALGAQEGFAKLFLSRTHNQGHTITPKMTSLFPDLFDDQHQTVRISTADNILLDRPPDLWKLDVEGLEADVIKGARRTLERSPPRAILAEIYDPFVSEVIDLLPRYRVRRAALAKVNYGLKFLDQIGGTLSDEFCPTSPTYVFMRLE
jgi:FkbM family methyltransferase